jgi:hypothetical protein
MTQCVRRRLVALLLTAALPACGACDSTSETSTAAPTPVTTTEAFTSTIEQLGSTTHTFTVAAAGTVQVKLTAVEPLATMALGVAVTTGGTVCGSDIAKNDNARSGATALSGTAAVGSYCVRVFDAGNVPSATSVTYSVEVTHP